MQDVVETNTAIDTVKAEDLARFNWAGIEVLDRGSFTIET